MWPVSCWIWRIRLTGKLRETQEEQLAKLSQEESGSTLAPTEIPSDELGTSAELRAKSNETKVSAELIRRAIEARASRGRYLPEELFADPAWDIVLYLLEAEIDKRTVTVSRLCDASAVPMTTALRWIQRMIDLGLLIRRGDPQDGRRIFVELSPQSSAAARKYFHEWTEPHA